MKLIAGVPSARVRVLTLASAAAERRAGAMTGAACLIVNATHQPRTIFEFGRFGVHPRRRELLADGIRVELGSRAFDVLVVLLEAEGSLVTKEELLQRVWPNTIVEENALQSQISAARKALGNERELIITVPGRGYRFVGDIRRTEADAQSDQPTGNERAPQAKTGTARRLTNLPAPLSHLIGRTAEIDQLLDLVDGYRLVTLTGPGGIGKTRLALEAARHVVPHFGDGVWLVELAPLSDPQLVGDAVAAVVGLQWHGSHASPDELAAHLSGKTMLLVLDNCEHVIGTAAQMSEALLHTAPRIRLLATSREPLGVEGERVYQVPPLDTPSEEARGVEEVLRHGAAQLFVERTEAAQRSFSLDDPNAAAIAAICRRLDGIPLAIELAAARSAALGVLAVAARLDQLFELLSRGRRTGPARHQTLRVALDWSYGLLPEDQRLVLRRASIFSSGFTLRAACALLADTGWSDSETVNHVSDLVAKSLLVSGPGARRARLRGQGCADQLQARPLTSSRPSRRGRQPASV